MQVQQEATTLERLLHPYPRTAFLQRVWEKEYLHVSNRPSDYYSDILTLNELEEYLSRNDVRYPSLRMIKAGKPIPVGEFSTRLKFGSYSSAGLIDVDRVRRLYDEGATVVLQLMRSSLSGVSAFANKLQMDLKFNVEATVYLTPPSEQGFTTHYDTHSVMALQVAGAKRWQLYDIPLQLPLLHETADTVTYTPPEPTKSILLQPGDLLYVPRGLAHDARSEGIDPSVHITIGLFPIMWRDLLEEKIRSLSDEPRFRRSPTGYFRAEDGEEFQAELRSVIDAAFERDNLGHLISTVRAQHLARQSRMTRGRISEADLLENISLQSRIALREGVAYQIELDESRVCIVFYNKKLCFPVGVRPAIEQLLSADSCIVGDLQESLDARGKLVLARTLVSQGFAALDRTTSRSK
jgi:hypothetical protein